MPRIRRDTLERRVLVLAAVFICCIAARGQASAPSTDSVEAKLPVYDVVAIKPNKTANGNVSIRISNETYTAMNVTLKMLVSSAYGVRDGLVTGLPGWGESAHWDIKAKVTEPDMEAFKKLKRDQFRTMLLPIVTERFHVQAHKETRTLPVYELVVAKDGMKIKLDPPPPPPREGEPKPKNDRGFMRINNNVMTATGISMSGLVSSLSDILNRTVIDKTGLTGEYDFELKWTPEDKAMGADNGSDETTPSIFTAVQEQLGLKLVSSKGPVETLVVDHAEEPTED